MIGLTGAMVFNISGNIPDVPANKLVPLPASSRRILLPFVAS